MLGILVECKDNKGIMNQIKIIGMNDKKSHINPKKRSKCESSYVNEYFCLLFLLKI